MLADIDKCAPASKDYWLGRLTNDQVVTQDSSDRERWTLTERQQSSQRYVW